ncbi:MAG: magnesium/cobalt transporter CorA [Chitinophagales bacterium]|nr:magnesium/cobalt transporter CorA [Chitinophagales bacterium]MDW8418698.1 magnesium/cobalt transporter CorA [Chitinophagales bacterium]
MSTRLPTSIVMHYFNADEYRQERDFRLEDFDNYDHQRYVCWINIQGALRADTMQQAARIFRIHPLVVEDIVHTVQRPKIEEYDDRLYVVLRMFIVHDKKIIDQQISFILFDNVVVTFCEENFGVFSQVIEKLQNADPALRKRGEDFLLYALLDSVVDKYSEVLEFLSEEIERLDESVISKQTNSQLLQLQKLKDTLLYVRKKTYPVRDLVNNLMRYEISFFDESNKYYLRDLQDHVMRHIEELDFLREQLHALTDTYYSMQNYRMNNVMKTLTGISFIMLPLNFIASIYGMNFEYMPGLTDPWGFWEIILVMLFVTISLVTFAFRRGWFSFDDFTSRKIWRK